MTKQEAIQAMEAGHKVTHRHFSNDEFIWIDRDGKLRCENNYSIGKEFWNYRTDETWNTDWEIFEPEIFL